MNLYIIRHADAGNREDWAGDDADRPLSELGHQQARALGEALRQQGVSLDAIVTSPLVRCRETAEGLAEAWSSAPPIHQHELLAPGELRRRKLAKELAGLGVETVAVVGHDPDLPALLGWILGVDPDAVYLAKGGAALVTSKNGPEKGAGRLTWIVTADWYMAGVKEPAGV